MFGLPATVDIPLSTDDHGAIRVRGTRVLLDRIVIAFKSGATAEEIAQQFPSVALRDVYLGATHSTALERRSAEITDGSGDLGVVSRVAIPLCC